MGNTVNRLARVMAFAVVAVGVVGPAFAATRNGNQPKFIKGKYDVPVSRDEVKQDWVARGYFSPRVASYGRCNNSDR